MALSATEELLDREGPAGLTARRVADRIGYTVGTLYLVFRNLDDLLVQVNARSLDTLHDEVLAAIDELSDPAAAIQAIGRVYVTFSHQHHGRWTHLFDARRQSADALPPWYLDKVRELFSLLEAQLRALLGEGGAGRTDCEREARALWGAVHGICVLNEGGMLDLGRDGAAGERPTDARAYAEQLITRYLAGFPGAVAPQPAARA